MNAPTPALFLGPPDWLTEVGFARSLRQLGVSVYGLTHRGLSPARVSRFRAGAVDAGDQGRPLGDPGAIVAALLGAVDRLGEGTILVPGTDEWAVFVADHQSELARGFRFQIPDSPVVRGLASKEGLISLCAEHGVPTPQIRIPQNAVHAELLAETLAYPVILKPVESRPGAWLKAVAHDPAALLRHYRAMEETPTAPNVLFQEYIPGDDDADWMFDGYFDGASRCLFGLTGQKLRTRPAHMGHCSLGICRQNPEVIAAATRFLTALGYRGIVDLGFRFDSRTGLYNLYDVNPRIGGCFRLFVDKGGLDVARALYLDLTGQEVSAGAAQEGRRWLKEDSDIVAFREYRRLHGLRAGSWLASLRSVDEGATFAWRDPMPFAASMLRLTTNFVGGRWRQRRDSSKVQAPAPAPLQSGESALP